MDSRLYISTAICGLSSVSVFVVLFLVFGIIHPDFDLVSDFISKLGVGSHPFAISWNVLGFAGVGCLFVAFGWLYGLCRDDLLLGACLAFAGIGFAFAAIPTDRNDPESPLSKAHYVSICLALAGYCFGLARLAGSQASPKERTLANGVIALAVLPIIFVAGGVSEEPLAHRSVLAVVFVWIVLTSIQLLRTGSANEVPG